MPGLCLLAMAPLETPPVNDPGGAGLDQRDPIIAPAGSGALAVYLDAGPGRIDRYRLQPVLLDDSPPVASRSIETLLGSGPSADSLALAGNRSGEAVLLWNEQGTHGLRAARLDAASGEQLGTTATILADPFGLETSSPVRAALSDNGTLAVAYKTWEATHLALYDAQFTPIGEPILLTEFALSNDTALAWHPDGTLDVAWTGSEQFYDFVIRTLRLGAEGATIGTVHDLTPIDFSAGNVAIGLDGTGGALVVWSATAEEPVLMGRRLDDSGTPTGSNTPLATGEERRGIPLGVWHDSEGAWVLLQSAGWTDDHARVSLHDETLGRVGPQYTLPGDRFSTGFWLADRNHAVLCRVAGNVDQQDVLFSSFETTTGTVVADQVVLDDHDGADQYAANVASNGAGRSLVVWIDERSGDSRVYGQAYDHEGAPIGGNRELGDPGDWNSETLSATNLPVVAMNEAGESIVVWGHASESGLGLRARRVGIDGLPVGEPITVATPARPPAENAGVEHTVDDGFAVVWEVDEPDGLAGWNLDLNLYAMRFDPDGVPLRPEPVRLNEAHPGIVDSELLGLFAEPDGSIRVVYVADPGSNADDVEGIYRTGVTVDGDALPVEPLTTAVNTPFRFGADGNHHGSTVAWTDLFWDGVYVRHYDPEGRYLAHDFFVSEGGNGWVSGVSLADDGTRHVLYYDYRPVSGGAGRYHWRVRSWNADGTPLSGVRELAVIQHPLHDYELPGFAAAWDRLLLAHSDDSGTDQGWDIHLVTANRSTLARGDYDGDGRVDGSDLAHLLAGWGLIGPDLDGDGRTNGLDLTILLGGWGG